MTKKQYIGWGVCLWLMAACSGDEKMDSPSPQPEVTSYPISCSVRQVNSMQGTRALIETDAALQAACAGTTNDAIAIWGTYTLDGSNTPTTVFTDKTLFYDASVGTNDETNQISWNYADEQYWVKDAAYTFRACYPQGELTGSAAGLGVTDYNTLASQKDLMVAYAQADTKATPTAMQSPVPLEMNHALAAVGFKVKSEDGSAMTLKSLAFKGLYTVGTFGYSSDAAPTVSDWINRKSIAGYEWKKGGLAFNAETQVTGFSSTELAAYAEDGYILVVPQEHRDPLLDLKTTMREYTDVSLGDDVAYEPGKKYTYVITVSPNQLKVTLSIKAWNKLDSSYDIIF